MRKPHVIGQQVMLGVIGLEIDPSALSDVRPVVITNLFAKATEGNENLHGHLLLVSVSGFRRESGSLRIDQDGPEGSEHSASLVSCARRAQPPASSFDCP